jgi:uncharacterized protein (TIGR02001 family)
MPIHRHRHEEKHVLALAALVLLGSAGTARCQTSANLTLQSAYTARGVALDTSPTLQLRVAHDTPDGWYLGGFGSPVRLYDQRQAQATVYGGRALRIGSAVTLDAGASHSAFSRDGHLDYSELYAGVMVGRASARLFYSPHYYGEPRTVYLDLATSWPLNEKLSLAMHAGVLHAFTSYGDTHPNSADARVGLATDVGDYRVQVGVQAKWHPYRYVAPAAPGLTASVSRYF